MVGEDPSLCVCVRALGLSMRACFHVECLIVQELCERKHVTYVQFDWKEDRPLNATSERRSEAMALCAARCTEWDELMAFVGSDQLEVLISKMAREKQMTPQQFAAALYQTIEYLSTCVHGEVDDKLPYLKEVKDVSDPTRCTQAEFQESIPFLLGKKGSWRGLLALMVRPEGQEVVKIASAMLEEDAENRPVETTVEEYAQKISELLEVMVSAVGVTNETRRPTVQRFCPLEAVAERSVTNLLRTMVHVSEPLVVFVLP